MIRKLLLLCSLLLLPLSGWADSPETIRIGTTQSLSGHFEEFGTEQLKGLQMWVSDVNSRGALLGRPVELVYHDDRSRSAGAADGFTRLIEKDGVDLLVGPYSSALTLASSVVAEAHGIPMVATAASAEEIWSRGLDNVFGIDTPANNYLTGINIARNNGARTAAILYKDTEFTTEVAAGVRRNAADGDINLLLDESYPPPQRNFDDLAQRLKSLDPDVIVGLSYLEDSIAIVQALKKAGVKPRMLIFTVGPALREFGDALGEDAEGITGVVQWLRSVPKPGAQDFAYRYRQAYGVNPGVHAAIGYSAGQVIEAAVRLADTTDHDAVREQLGNMKFRSLIGKYEVDATGRQVGKRNYVLQWQDGQRRLVDPADVAERPLVYPLP